MDPRLPKQVKRIIRLEPASTGGYTPKTIYTQEKSKRKGSRLVQPLERIVRRIAKTNKDIACDYLDRHDCSNTKKKDGWLIDLNSNLMRSHLKSMNRMY